MAAYSVVLTGRKGNKRPWTDICKKLQKNDSENVTDEGINQDMLTHKVLSARE